MTTVVNQVLWNNVGCPNQFRSGYTVTVTNTLQLIHVFDNLPPVIMSDFLFLGLWINEHGFLFSHVD